MDSPQDLVPIPWAGSKDVDPQNITLTQITGPCMPSFYKKSFEVELLSVDDNSFCTIRILDPTATKKTSETLAESMIADFFAKIRISPEYDDITEGEYFSVVNDGFKLRRVRVVKKNGMDREISCLDIDSNEPLNVPFYNIYIMRQSTLKFPRQIIKCVIYDLDLLLYTNLIQAAVASKNIILPKVYMCTIMINKEIPVVSLEDIQDPSMNMFELVQEHLSDLCKLSPMKMAVENIDENLKNFKAELEAFDMKQSKESPVEH